MGKLVKWTFGFCARFLWFGCCGYFESRYFCNGFCDRVEGIGATAGLWSCGVAGREGSECDCRSGR